MKREKRFKQEVTFIWKFSSSLYEYLSGKLNKLYWPFLISLSMVCGTWKSSLKKISYLYIYDPICENPAEEKCIENVLQRTSTAFPMHCNYFWMCWQCFLMQWQHLLTHWNLVEQCILNFILSSLSCNKKINRKPSSGTC